jgi:hypothetical protein
MLWYEPGIQDATLEMKYTTGTQKHREDSSAIGEHRPRGFASIGVFFAFGAAMAACAGITLLFPTSPLDALWALNKRGHEELSSLGRLGAIPFVILSPTLALAAVGWFRRRRWGWLLGITVIAINMAGDIGQVLFGEGWKGVVGLVIAGLLLVYMTRPSVRNYFSRGHLLPTINT